MTMTTGVTPRRRTISVLSSMVLILMFGIWLGVQTRKARRQREAVAAVTAKGGTVHYDYEFVKDTLTPGQEIWAPKWLRRAAGDEYFREIRQVSLAYDISTGKRYENVYSGECDDVLAPLAEQPGLRQLLLQGSQATDRGLASLRGLTGLRDLYIWDARQVGDAGAAQLKGLVHLKNLHLSRSKMTDKGLLNLAGLDNLEHLVLESHAFSDRGLVAVRGMKRLNWLAVNGTDRIASAITDDGLAHVAGLTGLVYLNVSYSRVTDRGLAHLAGLGKLEMLGLDGCEGITDAGLAHLAGLSNLKWLTLGGTKVAGPGLRHLIGLKRLQRLRLPAEVPEGSKERFRSMMPATTTVH